MPVAQNKYDIAIIGGGLGGLTLSIQLARQGRSVVLFEKETYPFHKVCGEYVSMESWNFLTRCGINLSALKLPKITELHISAPNGKLITQRLGQGGFGVSRHYLDHLLFEEAKRAGVKVYENCKVDHVLFNESAVATYPFQIHTRDATFNSALTFGSFGKRSNLDIKLDRDFVRDKKEGRQNFIAVKYHIKSNLPAHVIELHNFEDGYCGISKIEGDRYCLCYLTNENNLKRAGNDIKKMEEQLLYKNKFLMEYFSNSEFLYDAPLVISQINFESKTRVEDHIVLLGDAAGLITPLCGNGMSMAMRAAAIIAGLIPVKTRGMEDLLQFEAAYEREWKKAFSARLRAGRVFQTLFGNPLLTNLVIGMLKPFPVVVAQLIRLTHGKPF